MSGLLTSLSVSSHINCCSIPSMAKQRRMRTLMIFVSMSTAAAVLWKILQVQLPPVHWVVPQHSEQEWMERIKVG